LFFDAFSLSLNITHLSLYTSKLWRQWTTSRAQRPRS